MDKNKLVLPVSILIGCIILGGFYYAGEITKQKSIEKQQQIDLQAQQVEIQTKNDLINQKECSTVSANFYK